MIIVYSTTVTKCFQQFSPTCFCASLASELSFRALKLKKCVTQLLLKLFAAREPGGRFCHVLVPFLVSSRNAPPRCVTTLKTDVWQTSHVSERLGLGEGIIFLENETKLSLYTTGGGKGEAEHRLTNC